MPRVRLCGELASGMAQFGAVRAMVRKITGLVAGEPAHTGLCPHRAHVRQVGGAVAWAGGLRFLHLVP
jgi:hypothetical protein